MTDLGVIIPIVTAMLALLFGFVAIIIAASAHKRFEPVDEELTKLRDEVNSLHSNARTLNYVEINRKLRSRWSK